VVVVVAAHAVAMATVVAAPGADNLVVCSKTPTKPAGVSCLILNDSYLINKTGCPDVQGSLSFH
jgi:hypothetical protein